MPAPDPADPLLVNVAELWLSEPERRAADDALHGARQRDLIDRLQEALDNWTTLNPLDVDAQR